MFKLPDSVDTPQLLEAVRFEVDRLRAWQADSAVKRKAGAKPEPEPSRSPQTEAVLADCCGGEALTAARLTALAEQLHAYRPVTVHLTLTALPAVAMRRELVDWFRRNCRPDVLVSFTADRTIGGGIIIRTPGRVFDYSFRDRLSRGRAKIPEILRHV